MRMLSSVSTVAALLMLAACASDGETQGSPASPGARAESCDYNRDARAFDRIVEQLSAAGPAAFETTLGSRYAELTVLGDRAARLRAGRGEADAVACLVVASQSAMLQTFLPPGQRPSDAGAPPILARERAQAATASCNVLLAANHTLDDARRCALATLLEATPSSYETVNLLAAAAIDPGSTPNAESWDDQTDLMASFGDQAEAWSNVSSRIRALPGASEQAARVLIDSYLPRISCRAYLAGAVLRSRPATGGTDAERDAARTFSDRFRDAMIQAAVGLALELEEDEGAACASAPAGGQCRRARFEAISSACDERFAPLISDAASTL